MPHAHPGLKDFRIPFPPFTVQDKGRVFYTDIVQALELQSLLMLRRALLPVLSPGRKAAGPITGRTNRSATMSTGSSIRWGLENRTDRAYSMALLQLPDSNRSSTHMSTCTHLYCVFIYGINIPGCQTFTRKTIQGRLSCSGQNDFTLAWIGPRPDTLVIKSQTRNSATYVAEWVARQIGRPAVGRDSDCIRALYPKALDLAKMQFKERVDPKKRGEARQRPVEAWRCFREPRCSRTSGYERYDGCESSGKIPG
jgi:hypothetical protein